jgi:hypothetical protein
MIYEVEMNSFADGRIREVEVDEQLMAPNDLDQNLEKVFYFGQNDFQPRNLPSVSVGDVIRMNGKRFGVAMFGFKELGPDEEMNVMGKISKKSVDNSQYSR